VVEAGPAVAGGSGGSVAADGVWAHLAGARSVAPQVQALLDRVASQESHA
jgi:hypothetical protein